MVEGKAWPCAYVELGSPGLPHAVVPYPGLADADPQVLFQLGKALRSHPAFPKGANVNFYESTGPDQVLEKTFERGVEDFTLACGTGACAALAAAVKTGRCDRRATVTLPGGELKVEWERESGHILLTGPARTVFQGEI